LECDLQIPFPGHNNECDIDVDFPKIKSDVKEWTLHEWISNTTKKVSRRPCLTFSPSLLLSPMCFSPVIHMSQLVTIPQTRPDSTVTANKPSNENVFTFDAVGLNSPSSSISSSRRCICTILEDKELTADDMETPFDRHGQMFQYNIGGGSFTPPKSPSIATATRNRKNAKARTNHWGSQTMTKENDKRGPSENSKNVSQRNSTKSDQRKSGPWTSNKQGRTNSGTLADAFEAKKRSGNSMFLSMVSR
jgi:hypothetical protein